MARKDTLAETALETDQGLTNEENPIMYPPNYSAGSCPESAGDITVNQTVIDLGADKGAMKTDRFTDVAGNALVLSFTPLDSYDIEISINGLDQAPTKDFTYVGTALTLIGDALIASDVVLVRYAYEVTE